MRRVITAGAAVVLLGLGIGTAAAQPPVPYGPVPPPRYEAVAAASLRLLLGAWTLVLERPSLRVDRGSLGRWGAAPWTLHSGSLAMDRASLHLGPSALGLMAQGQCNSTTTGT